MKCASRRCLRRLIPVCAIDAASAEVSDGEYNRLFFPEAHIAALLSPRSLLSPFLALFARYYHKPASAAVIVVHPSIIHHFLFDASPRRCAGRLRRILFLVTLRR